ncbi:hypothetical protein ACTG9Q_27330 [Actinokineospora sp. 24-640]
MKTHLRSRSYSAWRYALPAVAVAAAMTATMVPANAAQALAGTAVTSDSTEYPPAEGPGDLREPQMLVIAQEADQAFRLSLTIATANPDQVFPEGSIEDILQAGVRSMPAERQERSRRAAQTLLADPDTRVAEFGRYGRYDPAVYARLGFDGAFRDLPVDWTALRRSLQAQADQVEAESAVTNQHALDVAAAEGIDPTAAGSLLKGLSMQITSIKAVNSNEYWGDEIKLGGTATDHKGVTKKIAPFTVKNDFDSGEVKTYNPPLMFSYANLTGGSPSVPATACNIAIMADIDFGGFADAVNAAWEQVKSKVLGAIEQFVGTALSAYLSKVIAGLLGKVIAWLVDKLIGWLIKLFMDDVFTPAKACMTVSTLYAHMYDNGKTAGWDNLRTSTKTLTFTGPSTHYQMNIHWKAHV